MVHSPIPTPAAIGCPGLPNDAVFWSAPRTSQYSAALPTARPNHDNSAVLRYSMRCQAHVESWTAKKPSQLTIADGIRTIEDPKSYPSKLRMLEASVDHQSSLHLYDMSDDELIDWPCAGSVAWRGPCRWKPRSSLRPPSFVVCYNGSLCSYNI